jgi:hypothetical protein
MMRLLVTVVLSAGLAGSPAALPGAAVAAAAPASATGSSSGLGVYARVAGVDVAEAQAAYPEGPARVRIASVDLGAMGGVHGVTASVSGDPAAGIARAEASVERVDLAAGPAGLRTGAIGADCVAGPDGRPEARVSLENAVVTVPGHDETRLAGTPAPNTVVTLPDGLGRVVLNERITEADGSLTVNAIHLTITRKDGGPDDEVTLAGANCRGGDGTATLATLTGAAAGSDTDGRGVAGVGFEVVDDTGTVAGRCTTDASGRCDVPFRPAAGRRYHVCVSEVPPPYAMPPRNAVCSGPYDVAEGESVAMARPFLLDPAGDRAGDRAGTPAVMPHDGGA